VPHPPHRPHPRWPDSERRSRARHAAARRGSRVSSARRRAQPGGPRMITWLPVRVALRALGANKLRTTLTMLGIVIGVGAVIALMSIGRGAQAQVTSQIQSLGTNLLFIRPGAQRDHSGVRSNTTQAPTLTLDDSDAIA